MSRFADLRLFEFLDALASNAPTPGGGTAAAIAGAMGTSLLMMVARLPKSRAGADEERVALSEACATLANVRDQFTALADTDTDAFNQVMAAYRLPKGTEAEKAARKVAIQLELKAATTAPLDTLRVAEQAMEIAVVVATHANRAAVSDVGVGIGLVQAASDGAGANVRINLESIHDDAFRTSATQDMDRLNERAASNYRAAREQLEG